MQNLFRVLAASAVIAATCVTAAPSPSRQPLPRAAAAPLQFRAGCDPKEYIPVLPQNQTDVATPQGQVPILVALVVGAQVWTCGDDGAFTLANSTARAYDFSCFAGSDEHLSVAAVVAALTSIQDPAAQFFGASVLQNTLRVAKWTSAVGADGSVTAELDASDSITTTFPDPLLKLKLVSSTPGDFKKVPSLPSTVFTATEGTLGTTVIVSEVAGGVPAEPTCQPGNSTVVEFIAEAVLYSGPVGA